MNFFLILTILFFVKRLYSISIDKFGAVEDKRDFKTSNINTNSLYRTVEYVTKFKNKNLRNVLIKKDSRYTFFLTNITNYNNFNFIINGQINFYSKNIILYSNYTTRGVGLLNFKNCQGINLNSNLEEEMKDQLFYSQVDELVTSTQQLDYNFMLNDDLIMNIDDNFQMPSSNLLFDKIDELFYNIYEERLDFEDLLLLFNIYSYDKFKELREIEYFTESLENEEEVKVKEKEEKSIISKLIDSYDESFYYPQSFTSYISSPSSLISTSSSKFLSSFPKFNEVNNLGVIDGKGSKWWRVCYLGKDSRPHLIQFEDSKDIVINNIYFKDSPKFTLTFKNCANLKIYNNEIYINSTITRILLDEFQELNKDNFFSATSSNIFSELPSVTYPLNTDGIDLAVTNAEIYNNKITNYDDGIVVKPCRGNWSNCQCSSNINVHNNEITYSTGLSVGSVPPNPDFNCVKNVTFSYNKLNKPFKAIYIKTNPGTEGSGSIENINYNNIYINNTLWYTIWIGPQQQNQPGTSDTPTGCNFLYPYIKTCPTQPLITLKNIELKNIMAENTLPLFQSPGVILCNQTNPCQKFFFENVTNSIFTGDINDIINNLPFFSSLKDKQYKKIETLIEDIQNTVPSFSPTISPLNPIIPSNTFPPLPPLPPLPPFTPSNFKYITDYVYGEHKNCSPDICFEEECFILSKKLFN